MNAPHHWDCACPACSDGRETARCEARAAIVAWLRSPAARHNYDEALLIADAIERGDDEKAVR